MHKLIIPLLICMVLLSACANKAIEDAFVIDKNDTDNMLIVDEDEPTDVTIDLPEEVAPIIIEQPPQEDITPPETFSLSITDITLKKPSYTDSETHDLGMIIDKENYNRLTTVIFNYTPDCKVTNPQITIRVNEKREGTYSPPCETPQSVTLSKSLFDEGRNTIEILSKNTEAYQLIDMSVTFNYQDGQQEAYPAKKHFFEASNNDLEVFETLRNSNLQSLTEDTFSLSEEEAKTPLTLTYRVRENQGIIYIYLNQQLLYHGEPQKGNHEVSLPPSYLKAGENSFVVMGEA